MSDPTYPYTKAQTRALEAAFKKGGAVYARGRRAGGAYIRCVDRLVDAGMLGQDRPNAITVKGLVALYQMWRARDARSGCVAYLEDLKAVEAALAEFPTMAATAAKRMGVALTLPIGDRP